MPSFLPEQEPEELERLLARASRFLERQQLSAAPVAVPAPVAEGPVQSALPIPAVEDVPVLTDIVEHTEPEPGASAIPPDMEALGQELAAAIQKRLNAEIPTLVEAVLQSSGIAQNIRQGLEEIARDAIQEFIRQSAERHAP
jgi:hypothetical protein